MKQSANLPTKIYAKCISLTEWCQYLQRNCGLSMDRIESEGFALAVRFAMEKGVTCTIKNDEIAFHPSSINIIT